jgi:hypothetical protein
LEGDATGKAAEDLEVPGPKPVRVWERRTRREWEEGEALFMGSWMGEPKRLETQESKGLDPD